MTMLDGILEDARAAVSVRQSQVTYEELRLAVADASPARSLVAALRDAPGMAVIAEVKRRSPSAGALADDVDPVAQAGVYEAAGAAAISVLTDERHFGGSLQDLRAVCAGGIAPVLRKDFILDEYGVLEARAAGADAVLLIARALDDHRLAQLLACAGEAGLEALVEVHDRAELERVLATDAQLIGINNRNLDTFEVSLETTLELAPLVPPERIAISESAIATPEDVRRVRAAGAGAVLVGTALMRSDDPGQTLRELAAA